MEIMTDDRLNEGQRTLRTDVVDALHRFEEEVMMGGAAGSGKTTMLSVVAQAAEEIVAERSPSVDFDGEEIESQVKIAAPTNRAAKILNAKLPPRFKATTLHYLLGARPQEVGVDDIPRLEAKREAMDAEPDNDPAHRHALDQVLVTLRRIKTLDERWEQSTAAGDTAGAASITEQIRLAEDDLTDFHLGGAQIGEGDIVIVDEASMVHEDLRAKTKATGAQIVWVGDPFQLEPVKGECWFHPPEARTLTQVMRQGGESGILKLATLIRQGEGNIKALGEAVRGCEDVEIVRQPDWDRLVEVYGDKWLTWRNGFKTKDHRFHTKGLNERYRYSKGYHSEKPMPGERLYITERFRNVDERAYLVKGDEVIVDALTEGVPRTLVLNECAAKRHGFVDIVPSRRRKRTSTDCICASIEESEGESPEWCNGHKAYRLRDRGAPHPWERIAVESEALRMRLRYETTGGEERTIADALVDTEYLYWDQEQSDRLYQLDKAHRNPDSRFDTSPRRATLRCTYAYAGSVHQAQGGEWPAVTIFWDAWRGKRHSTGYANALKWLYTAVTRASERVCIVII